MKRCSKCGIKKPINCFTIMTKSKDGLRPLCKTCVKIYNAEYLDKHREENRRRCINRLAWTREENRVRCKKRLYMHRDENKIKCKEYRKKNIDWLREYDKIRYYKKPERRINTKKYIKSERGRLSVAKTRDRRKRELGFNVLFENELLDEYEWHHIDDNNVVALPVDLHLLYLGKKHREKTFPIVEQLYPNILLLIGENKKES